MPETITQTELARRLCAAEKHNAFGVPPATAPCGAHLRLATTMWALIQTRGQAALKVIVEAAKENGAWTD